MAGRYGGYLPPSTPRADGLILDRGRSRLGGSVPLRVNQPATALIQVTGNSEDAQDLTVYIDPGIPSTSFNKQNRQLVDAVIKSGNDGASIDLIADVGQGLCFTMCASMLLVQVQFNRSVGGGLPVDFFQTVIGYISYGVIPGRPLNTLTRTINFGILFSTGLESNVIPPLDSAVIDIPAFARSVTITRTNGIPYRAEFLLPIGPGLPLYTELVGLNQLAPMLPITAMPGRIRIVNLDAVFSLIINAQFSLVV